MSAPLTIVPRPARPQRRPHFSFPKPNCPCSRCVRLRQRTKDLRGVIEIYEVRLTIMKRELWGLEP